MFVNLFKGQPKKTIFFNKLNKQQNLNSYHGHSTIQSGRSITEMLAVLSLIGVLTAGAVLGVRYALDKMSANLIYKEAASQALEILN